MVDPAPSSAHPNATAAPSPAPAAGALFTPEPPADLAATLGELRASGWKSVPVKQEIRTNAAARIRAGVPLFPHVLGYEDTVFPQLENALLAGQDRKSVV